MAEFTINLIKDQVMPLKMRRRIFWCMISYVSTCIFAVVAIVFMASRELLHASRQRADMARITTKFREDHPGQSDIFRYSDSMNRSGEQIASVLDVVKQHFIARTDVARILVGITAVLPKDIRLVAFSLDAEKGTVTFDLAAPIVSNAERPMDAGELVGLWNRSSHLTSELDQIQSVASNRSRIGGKPVFILRFSGRPIAGGA